MNGIELADGKKFFNNMFEMRSFILDQLEKQIKEKEKRVWEIIDLEIKMLNKNEKWKDIKGYEGLYQISNIGRVRSINYHRKIGMKRIIKPWKAGDGYLQIHLYKNGKREKRYIHRLVAEAFLSNPNSESEVNHKDENKTNNCVENIEWCNHLYNCKYSFCKSVGKYDLSGKLLKKYKSIKDAVKDTGCHSISKCCKGKLNSSGGFIWKYV